MCKLCHFHERKTSSKLGKVLYELKKQVFFPNSNMSELKISHGSMFEPKFNLNSAKNLENTSAFLLGEETISLFQIKCENIETKNFVLYV